ncbi:MAG: hypothetical protein DWQ04_16275 [Chloroflexi bacterium]|nr:MAG: hypothetical protein DWQ04_16275 [Chloroflexota bacterium]
MTYSKQVPAAERTLNILEVLAEAPDGLTASELLAEVDFPRSALFALLNTLKARDYVIQQDNRGKYLLGPALWGLSPSKTGGMAALIQEFQADIELDDVAETVVLCQLEEAQSIVVSQRKGVGRVQVVFQTGERRDATAVSDGQVLLAGLSPTKLTKVAPDWFQVNREILQKIRVTGTVRVETADTIEFACPICADGVKPMAALMTSVPKFKLRVASIDQTQKLLQQAASRLSFRIGAPVYQPYGWAQGESIGPNRALDGPELTQFLQEPWGARLACVRQDGTPHVLPLWYEWDGRFIWLTASPGAQWKTYVQDSQPVSLTIDEPWAPLRRAFIVGMAELVPNAQIPGGLDALRQRLAVRYLGRGAEKQVQLMESEGWEAVRIRPSRITGQQGLGSSDALNG